MIRLRVTLTLSLVFVSAIVLASLMVGLAREPADVPLAIGSFLRGIAGSPTAIGATGRTLTPVLLVGVAACISFRAGLFDVGQVGQFVLGGVVAGAVAAIAPGPGLLTIAISLSAGAATGGLWSLMVARVSAATGMQLVVLSLIANYLAEGLGRLATRTLFQDPKAYSLIATRLVPEDAWLATLLPRTSLHAGIIIALLAFAAMGVVLLRNSIGHRVTMFGYNPIAAALAGVRVTRFQSGILSVTGAICGAAGAIEVLGTFHRYQDASLGGPNSIAWTGVIAVILVPGRVLAAGREGALSASDAGRRRRHLAWRPRSLPQCDAPGDRRPRRMGPDLRAAAAADAPPRAFRSVRRGRRA